MKQIVRYFPKLSNEQISRFEALKDLYTDWNSKINVISRKDIDELYERHVLHSLSIAKITSFTPGTKIIDVGTGGGFPGIPLAILFPETQFTLVDSIGKKIKVVNEISNALNLENVTAIQKRAEEFKEKFDFVVSRAVTSFPDFVHFTQNLISPKQKNSIHNGILYLKGGDFNDEIAEYKKHVVLFSISDYFSEPFFETKKIIYLPIK